MKFLDAVVIKAKHRTCNQCGASWFVDKYLENRAKIQGVAGDFSSVASSGVTRMAAINAANSASKGLQNECPSCGSKDYSETTVLHTVTKHPNVPQPVGLCPFCRKPIDIEAKKCPSCTGDIGQDDSDKLKSAYAEAEVEFAKTQEILQERLKVQKRLRRRTNATVLLGMLVLAAGAIFVVSMIDSLNLSIIMPVVYIVLTAYVVAMITASVLEKKNLVRFAIEQEKNIKR